MPSVSGYRSELLSTDEAIITWAPLRRQENSLFCRRNRLTAATSADFEESADCRVFGAVETRPGNLPKGRTVRSS